MVTSFFFSEKFVMYVIWQMTQRIQKIFEKKIVMTFKLNTCPIGLNEMILVSLLREFHSKSNIWKFFLGHHVFVFLWPLWLSISQYCPRPKIECEIRLHDKLSCAKAVITSSLDNFTPDPSVDFLKCIALKRGIQILFKILHNLMPLSKVLTLALSLQVITDHWSGFNPAI